MTAIGQGAVPADLERRLAAVEAAVARRHLVLAAGRERAFLGTAVELTARVGGTPGAGPPAGAAVTFAATWGRLAAAEGYQRLAGGAVTVRAWPDGTARAVLEPLPGPPSGAERAALESHLGALDPDAATAEQAAAGLESLVRAYRWEPGGDLRRAVDRLFGRLADDPAAAAGGDPASAWPFVEATVFAHLHAADGGVEGLAAAGVRFLDWRPAWLAVFRRVEAEDGRLEEELRRELARRRARGGDAAGSLLDGLYATIGRYVDGRRGAVGATVGRHVAGRALAAFADRGLADLPAEARLPVGEGLSGAVRVVEGAGGGDLLAGIGRAREEARREAAAAAEETRGALERGLAGKADRGALDALGAELRARVDAKADVTALDATRRALEAAVATRAERGEVDRLRTALDSNLRLLQREVPRFTVQNPEAFRPVVVVPPDLFRPGGPGGPR